MVLKHPTFYTPMATHGHIQEANPIQNNRNSNIENLLEDTKWVFAHSNIIETGPALVEMLANKTIIAVSNGSYKDKHGMAAWVFYMELAPKIAISQGVLTTPGNPNTQGLIDR